MDNFVSNVLSFVFGASLLWLCMTVSSSYHHKIMNKQLSVYGLELIGDEAIVKKEQ